MSAASSPYPLFYSFGTCFMGAYFNQQNKYKDFKLRLIAGSLGMNGHFEYGGRDWKKADFETKISGEKADFHAWLEDKDGNVYDFLYDEYSMIARLNTGKGLRRTGLLEGVPKADLEALGIEYVPADADTQKMMYALFLVRAVALNRLLTTVVKEVSFIRAKTIFSNADIGKVVGKARTKPINEAFTIFQKTLTEAKEKGKPEAEVGAYKTR